MMNCNACNDRGYYGLDLCTICRGTGDPIVKVFHEYVVNQLKVEDEVLKKKETSFIRRVLDTFPSSKYSLEEYREVYRDLKCICGVDTEKLLIEIIKADYLGLSYEEVV